MFFNCLSEKKRGKNKGSEKEKVSAFDSDGLESKYF